MSSFSYFDLTLRFTETIKIFKLGCEIERTVRENIRKTSLNIEVWQASDLESAYRRVLGIVYLYGGIDNGLRG